ncbi:MAG TPA: hypothetical protein PLM67_14290, partial [Thermoanaerobaculales bacterium]|nr:hypothetical protein [Thermoanaerobaculales bacterium]
RRRDRPRRRGGRPTTSTSGAIPPFSEELVLLYGDTAFFRFAIQLLQDVPESEKAEFGARFAVDDAVLDRFLEWVASEEILTADALAALRSDAQGMDDAARGIRIEILNATQGLEAGYREAVESDDQIEAALGLLPDAQDMWRVWQERVQKERV